MILIPEYHRIKWINNNQVVFAEGTPREYKATLKRLNKIEITHISKDVWFCPICWELLHSELCECGKDVINIGGNIYQIIKREAIKHWR